MTLEDLDKAIAAVEAWLDQESTWDNDLDWGDAVTIMEDEVITQGPLRPADEQVIQTFRESDCGWDYLPQLPSILASHG